MVCLEHVTWIMIVFFRQTQPSSPFEILNVNENRAVHRLYAAFLSALESLDLFCSFFCCRFGLVWVFVGFSFFFSKENRWRESAHNHLLPPLCLRHYFKL